MEENFNENLIYINKNLRDQLEITFRLLKLRIKEGKNETFNKLDNLLNEMEILKTSLTFSLQKHTEILRYV